MGSNLDGRPAPVSLVWQFPECRLVVRCLSCDRMVRVPIGLTAARHRLPRDARLYELAARLRCRVCGGEGRVLEVEGWRRG